MKSKLIIDGNSFYEIDTECLKQKELLNKQHNRRKAMKMQTKYNNSGRNNK